MYNKAVLINSDKIRIKVFTSGKIVRLELRNRTIKSGYFEGMCRNAMPGEALIEHHRKVAAGGIGLTDVTYCAISHDRVRLQPRY